MPSRVNGASSAHQNLSGGLQFYYCYTLSPGAFTDPDPNPPEEEQLVRQVNILVTDDIEDQSQKNFEIILQSIGFRAMPVIMGNPNGVLDVSQYGAQSLQGEGFVWKFSAERDDVYKDYGNDDPVGLLVKELDGVILDSGVRVTTVDGSPSGQQKNIEFVRQEIL